MAFFQDPPRLGNQYDDDALLREYLERAFPPDARTRLEPELRELGELGGKQLYQRQLEDRLNVPVLTQWDAWGQRVDTVEVTPLWREAARLCSEHGLVAVPYEARLGERSRVHQLALIYLLDASLDVYSCPLAMTDEIGRASCRERV